MKLALQLIKKINNFDIKWVCKINHQEFNPILDLLFKIFTHVGSFVAWISIAFILYVFDLFEPSFWLYATCINGGIIALPIKLIIRRDRPFIAKKIKCKINLKDKFIISKHTSFPSGHSVYYSSCTIILLVIFGYWWLYFILIPFAFIVAFTRVNLGAHYPSDVIFGYIIGFFISLITICIFPFYLPIFWEISDKLRYFWNLTFP